MPKTTTVKVEGLRELGASMKELSLDMRFKTGAAATRKGANVVRNAARARAPEADEPHKLLGVIVQPGNLKRSIITSKTRKSTLTAEYDVRVRRPKNLTKKMKAAGNVGAFYWHFVEFNSGTWRQKPRASFLRTGFAESKEEAQETITTELRKGIEKARAKAASRMPPKPKA